MESQGAYQRKREGQGQGQGGSQEPDAGSLSELENVPPRASRRGLHVASGTSARTAETASPRKVPGSPSRQWEPMTRVGGPAGPEKVTPGETRQLTGAPGGRVHGEEADAHILQEEAGCKLLAAARCPCRQEG